MMKLFGMSVLLLVCAGVGGAVSREAFRIVEQLDQQRTLMEFSPAEPGRYVIEKIDLAHSTADSVCVLGIWPDTLEILEGRAVRFIAADDSTQVLRFRKVGELLPPKVRETP